MADVTADDPREEARVLAAAIVEIAQLRAEVAALGRHARQDESVWARLIAEQREQLDVCLAEWPTRYESPPWRSLERMYAETYPGRDVVIGDVLRWADTFIAARRHEPREFAQPAAEFSDSLTLADDRANKAEQQLDEWKQLAEYRGESIDTLEQQIATLTAERNEARQSLEHVREWAKAFMGYAMSHNAVSGYFDKLWSILYVAEETPNAK